MELRHLRYFCAVAEGLSFSGAARKLHVSQPSLSRQIRDFEEECGGALFARTPGGRVSLTELGCLCWPQAKDILERADRMMSSLGAASRAEAAVLQVAHFGTLMAITLVPALERMARLYPSLSIELCETLPGDAVKALAAGRVEAFFTGAPLNEIGLERESQLAFRSPQALVLPMDHAMVKRRRIRLADFKDDRWCVWDERLFPGFESRFRQACEAEGFEPKIARRIQDFATMVSLVARREAIGYTTSQARLLKSPGVFIKEIDGASPFVIEIRLVWQLGSRFAAPLAALAEASLRGERAFYEAESLGRRARTAKAAKLVAFEAGG